MPLKSPSQVLGCIYCLFFTTWFCPVFHDLMLKDCWFEPFWHIHEYRMSRHALFWHLLFICKRMNKHIYSYEDFPGLSRGRCDERRAYSRCWVTSELHREKLSLLSLRFEAIWKRKHEWNCLPTSDVWKIGHFLLGFLFYQWGWYPPDLLTLSLGSRVLLGGLLSGLVESLDEVCCKTNS